VRTRLVAAAAAIGVSIGAFVAYDDDGSTGAAAAARRSADAVAVLERAVAERPNDADAWRDLALAYVGRVAENGDLTLYPKAEAAVAEAEALTPGDPGVAIARGSLALGRHLFAEALDAADAALAVQPGIPGALTVRVDALVELGRYEDAASTLQELLDIRPSLPALARASYLRQLHGDRDGALLAAQQAEIAGAGKPSEVAIVVAIQGDLHLEAGDVDEAEVAYERALRLAPGLVGANLGVARVAIARGDEDAGASLLRRMMDKAPEPSPAILLAGLRGEQDVIEGGRDRLDAEVEAGAIVDLEQALFEADHGDAAEAVTLAEGADTGRPTVFSASIRGWALHRAGRSLEAVPHAERSVRLGTTDPTIRTHAAAVFHAVGDVERARAELRAAFASAPWPNPGVRPLARELASALGVTPPESWAPPG
jgi:tetratricopeptide (TPR) repeat protein